MTLPTPQGIKRVPLPWYQLLARHLGPTLLDGSDAIFATLTNFFKLNKFFSANLEKKGNYVYNHPASKPEPLLLNISYIPLLYQVDPTNFRKILLQSVTFLNGNDRVAPNNK